MVIVIIKFLLWFWLGVEVYRIFTSISTTHHKKRLKILKEELEEQRERIRQQRQNYYSTFISEPHLFSDVSNGLRKMEYIFGYNSSILLHMTDNELKTLYRKKAKTFHPDHGGNDKDFQDLNNCYNVIKHLKRYIHN